MKYDSGEVVAILPFIGKKILIHLRDFNPRIRHPGCWAYLSGSIQVGEEPTQAAKREILEEIGYEVDDMTELGRLRITEFNNLVSHTFCCSIRAPFEKLTLSEGIEITLATPEEIRSRRIFSKKLNQFFPLAPTSYMEEALTLALAARR